MTNKSGKKYIIELKIPKESCETPNEMHRAIKDVKFFEQQKQNKITSSYSVLLTQRQSFWKAAKAINRFYQFSNGNQIEIQPIEEEYNSKFYKEKTN